MKQDNAIKRRAELARRQLSSGFDVALSEFAQEFGVTPGRISQDLRHPDYLADIEENKNRRYIKIDHRGTAILEQAITMAENAKKIQNAALDILQDDPMAALRLLDKASEAFYKGVETVKWLKGCLDPRFNPKLAVSVEVEIKSPSDELPDDGIRTALQEHLDSGRFTNLPAIEAEDNGRDGHDNGEDERDD